MKDRLTEEQRIAYSKNEPRMVDDKEKAGVSKKDAERKRRHERAHRESEAGKAETRQRAAVAVLERLSEGASGEDEDRANKLRRQMHDPKSLFSKEAIDRLPEDLSEADWAVISKYFKDTKPDQKTGLDPESLRKRVNALAAGLNKNIEADVDEYEKNLARPNSSTSGLQEMLNGEYMNEEIFKQELSKHIDRLYLQAKNIINERKYAKLSLKIHDFIAPKVAALSALSFAENPITFKQRAEQLLREMDEVTDEVEEEYETQNEKSQSNSEGSGGGRWSAGSETEGNGPRRRNPERLGMGKINSIEDLAYYMEIMDPKYSDDTKQENRILVPLTNDNGEQLFAFRYYTQNGEIRYLNYPTTQDNGQRQHHDEIIQLTQKEIDDFMKKIDNERNKRLEPLRAQLKESYDKNLQEEVRVVNPANFMNWIRDRWVGLHNDDPDNPRDFFTDIQVSHADMYRIVTAGNIHKESGTFLRSKFLRDEDNNRVVYNSIKEEIVKEIWITGGLRNNEVIFKQIMPIDEKLFEVFRDRIAVGNLYAKMAFEGKSTLASLLTLAENFQEKFNYLTGKKENIIQDTNLGNTILTSYLIYYHMTDIPHLVDILGKKPSMFNKKNILAAMREVMDSLNLNTENDEAVIEYFSTPKEVSILDEKYNGIFDKNGDLDISNEENIKVFLKFFNAFSPAQKDMRTTSVIRKMVENQVKEMTGIKSASGFGELLAWLAVYHTGAAARHDQKINARNSQVKYEYPEGYKKKQIERDAAGNIYNLHSLKRAAVGMMEGMQTRNGEILIDILEEAASVRKKVSEEIKRDIDRIKAANPVLESQIKAQVESEKNPEIQRLEAELNLTEDPIKKKSLGKKIEEMKESIKVETEKRFRDSVPELREKLQDLDKSVDTILRRLDFDEAQFLQYAGMELANGAQLFLEDLTGKDLPTEEIAPLDKDGRRVINAQKFSEWMQGSGLEKRMRYVLSTWPLPLGTEVRRMVNVRESSAPKYETMTIFETIFGHENSQVMKMFQTMVLRQAEELKKKGKNINLKDFEFADKNGTVIDRGKLKNVLGYTASARDENGQTTKLTYHEPIIDEPATLAVKAYEKVRIANFMLSHTEKHSPYEFWDVHLREGFFAGLRLSNYFDHHDVHDIEIMSNNRYWLNFVREVGPATLKAFGSGFFGGFKELFKAAFSS